mmetsp:Transcript_36800/g.45997  ORF Transcript_36800/g.45997 Transcript_36800/m.45997 type:complete len:107 (-) Transcript_36800:633-953(-)
MMLDHLLIKGNDMDRAISAICKETSGLCEEVRAATKKGWDARTKANISDDGWDYDLVKYGNDLSTEIYNAKKGKDPNLPSSQVLMPFVTVELTTKTLTTRMIVSNG